MAYKITYLDGTRDIVWGMDEVCAQLGEIREVVKCGFPASKVVDYILSIGGKKYGKR